MKRTPTRPWEIRNERARLGWIAGGRKRSLYRMPNRRWTNPVYRMPVLVDPPLPMLMAPLPTELRTILDILVSDSFRLMGPGNFLPVIHVGDDT